MHKKSKKEKNWRKTRNKTDISTNYKLFSGKRSNNQMTETEIKFLWTLRVHIAYSWIGYIAVDKVCCKLQTSKVKHFLFYFVVRTWIRMESIWKLLFIRFKTKNLHSRETENITNSNSNPFEETRIPIHFYFFSFIHYITNYTSLLFYQVRNRKICCWFLIEKKVRSCMLLLLLVFFFCIDDASQVLKPKRK